MVPRVVRGVRIAAVEAVVPAAADDCQARLQRLLGDAERARNVVAATGIRSRRLAAAGTTSLDLCVAAAERMIERARFDRRELGSVFAVSLTPAKLMPGNAAQAQARLGLDSSVLALEMNLACAGYQQALYLAALEVAASARPALVLDGDVQSAVLAPDDAATVPVLADASSATLLVPDAAAAPISFGFLTAGGAGAALKLAAGGTIQMDGFAVFRFVAGEVTAFLREFLAATASAPADFDAFVPHQANVYMVRQLARSLGFTPERTWISADELGNSASASVPVTLCRGAVSRRERALKLLLAGFGAGLAASAASVELPPEAAIGWGEL